MAVSGATFGGWGISRTTAPTPTNASATTIMDLDSVERFVMRPSLCSRSLLCSHSDAKDKRARRGGILPRGEERPGRGLLAGVFFIQQVLDRQKDLMPRPDVPERGIDHAVDISWQRIRKIIDAERLVRSEERRVGE